MALGIKPLSFRNDGFSMYFYSEPPMTWARLERDFIDPFAGSNVQILEWTLGPGSVFCFHTQVGEIYGDRLTEAQWAMCRPRDRWVNENVHALIEEGGCPLRVVAERSHELGQKVYGRMQMQYEYAPFDRWLGVAFTGDFNRKHPEYRIPGSPMLDFKHEEVRDFKLAILREAVEAGLDGISVDFCSKPGPFFKVPDCDIMTGFIQDCRSMLDEVGKAEDRRLDILVRMPYLGAMELGLDWRRWMQEQYVDIVVPSVTGLAPGKLGFQFAVPPDEFVAVGKKTGCRVYGCIWFDLGLVSHDPATDGKKRYAKLKTREMYHAEALLHHQAGVDGIQLAMGTGDEWLSCSWQNDLADPDRIVFADKHYMVDVGPHIPVRFLLSDETCARAVLPLHIGDDVARARVEGYEVTATLVLHSRGLQAGEALAISINGQEPVTLVGGSPDEKNMQPPVEWQRKPVGTLIQEGPWIFEPDWWRWGEHRVALDAGWLHSGANTIALVYSTESPKTSLEYWISWIDLLLDYEPPERPVDRISVGFRGKEAVSREAIGVYTGKRAAEAVVGKERKQAYLLNYAQLKINYGDNVEFQLRREQVILCPQTVAFLYGAFTPLDVGYVSGSRPVLEAVVQNATAGCETEGERALALMRFCRDLYLKQSWHQRGMEDYVYGGTEEQLIDKGEQLCECLGRLQVALCEVAGISGRIVMHTIGGHIGSEVYVDGQWAYMDPRCGVSFRKPDGSFASVWELWTNPRLMRNQGDRVMDDVSRRWRWEYRLWKCEAMYFDPREVTGFQNYRLADADRYGYGLLTEQQVIDRGLYAHNRTYRETIDTVFGTSDALWGWRKPGS